MRKITVLIAVAALVWLASSLRAAAPTGRFVINGAIVTDSVTGLTWQKASDNTTRLYTDANTYCTANTPALPGSGWRLPSLKELATLYDASIGTGARWDSSFSGVAGSYWTGDQRPPGCPSGGFCQMEIDFSSGTIGSSNPSGTGSMIYTRCVH